MKATKQLMIADKSVVIMRNGYVENTFFLLINMFYRGLSPVSLINASAFDRIRVHCAFACGINSFERSSRFSIFKNLCRSTGAGSHDLFHRGRKYFRLSPRAARKMRSVSTTKLKRVRFRGCEQLHERECSKKTLMIHIQQLSRYLKLQRSTYRLKTKHNF